MSAQHGQVLGAAMLSTFGPNYGLDPVTKLVWDNVVQQFSELCES